MGCVLTRDEEVQLRGMSNLPCDSGPGRPRVQAHQSTILVRKPPHQLRHLQRAQPKQQLEPAKIWKPTESLDLAAVGLQ